MLKKCGGQQSRGATTEVGRDELGANAWPGRKPHRGLGWGSVGKWKKKRERESKRPFSSNTNKVADGSSLGMEKRRFLFQDDS